MLEKSSKCVARIIIGIVIAVILYSLYLLYWKMYFVGM
jgi:hypothetical protein